MQNRLIVEIYVRECVEAIEDQIQMFVREGSGIRLKHRLILPISQANPLQAVFVIAIERVRDETVMQQVGLHHPGNLRGMPLQGPAMASIFGCRSAGGAPIRATWGV